MKRFHLYLTGLILSLVLLSVNRLTIYTEGYLVPHEYLRWLDFNAMLPISLLFLIFYWLLKTDVETSGGAKHDNNRALFWINFLIIITVYIYGVSSGVHEPMNYLNHRYCMDGHVQTQLCQIINENDEGIGHILYYLAAVTLSIVIAVIEYLYPRKLAATDKDLVYVTGAGLLIALGIFANLARDVTLIPMTSFSLIAIATLGLLSARSWDIRRQPLTYYLALAYSLGVVAVVTYKIALAYL